jgi:hypothetical protein
VNNSWSANTAVVAWAFWIILVAFLFGVLRVPVALLQLSGMLALNAPTWYVQFQGLLGLIQFGIGLAMVVGYRHPVQFLPANW